MMKIDCDAYILAASDIHGDESALERLQVMACDSRCLAFLYAGDLDVENYFISGILRYRNFVFLPVQGNCDNRWDWTDLGLDLPLYRTCSFRGLRIFLSHGHYYCDPESAGLENKDFDLVITGHSHVNDIHKEVLSGKEVVFLNPGSPSRPRGRSRASYALILFKGDSVRVQTRALDGDGLLSEETISVHKLPEGKN